MTAAMVEGRGSRPINPADADAIAFVAALIHREGERRSCKCEKCRALARVVRLARKAVGR